MNLLRKLKRQICQEAGEKLGGVAEIRLEGK